MTEMGVAEPFYFGTRAEPLFGVHHRPASPESARGVGVVLCYPRGHEYIVSHATYRQLAKRLSEEGFHVLRFDYFGCGDSSGACRDGTPTRWLADVNRAIGELRLRSGTPRTCLVGSRLGATLCALASAGGGGGIEHMVLWDPIVSGRRHLAELKKRHEAMLRRSHFDPGPAESATGVHEFLGFEISDVALREIGDIDLLALRAKPAGEVLLLQSQTPPNSGRLVKRLEELGSRVELRHVPMSDPWVWIEDAEMLVSHEILGAVVAWICGGYS